MGFSLSGILGKVGGFIAGLGPVGAVLEMAANQLLSLFKMGISENNEAKIRYALDGGRDFCANLRSLADQFEEVLDKADAAIDPDGDGGNDVTVDEGKKILAELDDIPGELAAVADSFKTIAERAKAAL